MNALTTIPLTIEPEATALVAELGLQSELEQMLEHARKTISGLQSLTVQFAPAYDTGEEGIIIQALRSPASSSGKEWSWNLWSEWIIDRFPPDVLRYFTLLDVYGPNHAG